MTILNIRSDPVATWECAKQVQVSSQVLGKCNACTLHFGDLKKTHIDRDDVHLHFLKFDPSWNYFTR